MPIHTTFKKYAKQACWVGTAIYIFFSIVLCGLISNKKNVTNLKKTYPPSCKKNVLESFSLELNKNERKKNITSFTYQKLWANKIRKKYTINRSRIAVKIQLAL